MRAVIHPLPGLIHVERTMATATLRWGPLAGVLGWQTLDDWKRSVLLVLAADFTDAVAATLGLRAPPTFVPASAPILRAAVRAAPAYCIAEELGERLLAAGCRLCRVGYSRFDGRLLVSTRGAGWPERHVHTELYGILASGRPPAQCESEEWIDRVILGMTGGALSAAGVRAAVRIARDVDDLLVSPARWEEYAAAQAELRELKAELPDEPAWLETLDPDVPWRGRFAAWEESLLGRQRAGEGTRAQAERLVAALDACRPPPRVRVAGLGSVPIVTRPPCEVRVAGDDGAWTLRLPPTCWAHRRL